MCELILKLGFLYNLNLSTKTSVQYYEINFKYVNTISSTFINKYHNADLIVKTGQ